MDRAVTQQQATVAYPQTAAGPNSSLFNSYRALLSCYKGTSCKSSVLFKTLTAHSEAALHYYFPTTSNHQPFVLSFFYSNDPIARWKATVWTAVFAGWDHTPYVPICSEEVERV